MAEMYPQEIIDPTPDERQGPDRPARFAWRRTLVWTAALATLAYFATRHASHLVQLLPLIVLFACPLMHLMHHGHHQRGHGRPAT